MSRADPGGCGLCGRELRASPSNDFCSEDCQEGWHTRRVPPGAHGGELAPDEDLPEAAPVRPLSWLGPPPPGARAGHEVLDEVTEFAARFSAFPSAHCAPTLALWYAHTHAADRFYVTPRLILDSAEPESGKTRVLEVAQYLVAAPEMTISATTAALFRLVREGPITILFDEVDAIFHPKNGGNNEDLRGLLNAGYKRSATVARCVGDASRMKVERFPVYAPAALAGIAGRMPATITTRAITIHMRRRRPDEHVHPFHERTVARQARPIRAALAAWIDSEADRIGDTQPPMPPGVADRAAEIWEPLLAIADTAGGHWPDTARAACRHFTLEVGTQATSLGVKLLRDLRDLFTRAGTDRMRTTDILAALTGLEESPWADLYGKPLDARRLAKELGRYGVEPGPFKDNTNNVVKGYQTGGPHGLTDAWDRYATDQPITAGCLDPASVTDPAVTTHPAVTALTSEVTAVTAVTAPASPPNREDTP